MLSTVAGRGEMAMVRGELLPIFRLHRLFGIEGAVNDPRQALLIVIEGGGQRCALMVDELKGQQQVIVKSLGPMFDKVTGVFGGAILGDGRVGLILDAAGLVRLSHGQGKIA
jgi:two-component system chemotaxis sensor kinase CheA